MSVVVDYPAKITSYSFTLSQYGGSIRLQGHSKPLTKGNKQDEKVRFIADVEFISPKEGKEGIGKPFINRGGFLKVTYHLSMLPSFLILLNQERDIYLAGNGNLSNK